MRRLCAARKAWVIKYKICVTISLQAPARANYKRKESPPMKLNHDCVRDLLLYIEENLSYGYYIDPATVEIKKYSHDEILYSADKLLEANYLDGIKKTYIGSQYPTIHINSITWSGHQFLDNIRDDGIWKSTKNVVSKFSSVSLSMLCSIASQIITSLIKSKIDLH